MVTAIKGTSLVPRILITLEMDDEEAGILLKVLTFIGGSSEGPRGKLDDIKEALRQAGVQEANFFHEIVEGPFSGMSYLCINKEK